MVTTETIHVLSVGEIRGSGIPDVNGCGSIAAVDASSEVGAIRQLRDSEVDCIVVGQPFASDPRPLLYRVRECAPSVPIILVGDPDGPDEVIEALNAGASRYLRASEVEADLTDLIIQLADDNRIHTAIDTHRELTRVLWVAAADLVSETNRRGMDAALHHNIETAESIEWIWIARQADGEDLLDVREPFTSTLQRSQIALLLRESGAAAIERALDTGEVQTVENTPKSDKKNVGTFAAIPFAIDWGPDGLLLLTASTGTPLDNADRSILQRFSNVIGRLFSLTGHEEDTATRTNAVMELVSHEVRNPITTAMSNLQFARETGEQEAFDRIQRALEEIDRTISTLNTLYSRNGSDQATDKPFKATAKRAWEATATPLAHLELDDIGIAHAHHDLLERLLVNLFRNAIQYSSGDVTVTVGRLPNGFYVEDDGPGIPTEQMDSIFEWGFTTSNSGFGVGLPLVEDIADYHGWSIELDEIRSGGTRFEITDVDLETAGDPQDDSSKRVTDQ